MNKSSTTLFNFKTLKHTVLAKTNFYLQNAPNGLKISNLFFQGPNKTSIQKKPLSNLTLQEWVKVLKEICQMAKVEKYSQFSHMFFFIIFLDLSKPPPWKSAFFAYVISPKQRATQRKKLQNNVFQAKRNPHGKIQLFLSTFKNSRKSRGCSCLWPFIFFFNSFN